MYSIFIYFIYLFHAQFKNSYIVVSMAILIMANIVLC